MLNIEENNGHYRVTLGVPCNKAPKLALDKPLTFSFSTGDVANLEKIIAKIAFLQASFAIMPPEKKERVLKQIAVFEAFETSKFEGVFREAKIDEPGEALQQQIIYDPEFKLDSPAFLLMRNTARSRHHALELADRNMKAGKALFTADDLSQLQGIIYNGFNQLMGYNSPLQAGYILTGQPRKCMVGDAGFRTAHPDVLEEFMQDWQHMMASPLKDVLHPVIFGLLAGFSFVQIHPFEDGNGRVSREILESVISHSQNGICQMRGVVAVSNSQYKPELVNTYPHLKPDYAGNINLAPYLQIGGRQLERSLDNTLQLIQVQMPEISR